jgi:hypothetical protein
MRLPLAQARANLAKPCSRWHRNKKMPDAADLARHRLSKGIVFPEATIDRRIDAGSGIFAIGSCFAREIEAVLIDMGLNVLSKAAGAISEAALGRRGFPNRYNPFAMLNDVAFAFGVRQFDERSIIRVRRDEDLFMDLLSRPTGGMFDYAVTLQRRARLLDLFSRLKESTTVVITLGLIEAWFDKETGLYLNVSPDIRDASSLYPDRFEFRVLSYEDNLAALDEIYRILSDGIGKRLRVVVTVSPVPLTATYTGQDVLVANMHSKSVLRACADTWVAQHPEHITYFPSYEMAMLSDPDVVWREDRLHVQPDFVRHITGHFVQSCLAA